jgi:hypothetical protein
MGEVSLSGAARPGASESIGDQLRLHRYPLRLDGREYTVITPRPGTGARFSTNRYHDTWHVLSDLRGARLLARLLWGLAYQRVPGTMVAIGPPLLDPNPFDAEPADRLGPGDAHLAASAGCTAAPAPAATGQVRGHRSLAHSRAGARGHSLAEPA